MTEGTTTSGGMSILGTLQQGPKVESDRTGVMPSPELSPQALPDYLQMILTAKVYDVAKETPLHRAKILSGRMKNNIYFKREDQQEVFSFKLRGSYNRMYHMSQEERAKGVVACSAGNHAQGVALAAQKMNIPATIFMPTATPEIKVAAVRSLGATVVLHGADFDGAKAKCMEVQAEGGQAMVHPFDDPYVIAGNGTVGMEIMRQAAQVDAIFVTVGGGGLIAGIVAYVKRIFKDVKVYGVETEDACAMTQSLKAQKRVELDKVGLFADGAAVRQVGQETFRVCMTEGIDDMILVTNDELCAAIKDCFSDTRTILEPAGALAVAGCKKFIETHGGEGGHYVCVTSGANMNFDRLKFVAERAAMGEGREGLFTVTIPERAGELRQLYAALGERNVSEFSYRYSGSAEAHIFMALTTVDSGERSAIVAACEAKGYSVTDMTDNELAKAHTRYLVGGRSNAPNERLLRFVFPERPHALRHFLVCLQSTCNISLFHYRNVGGDVASVLIGLQVDTKDEAAFTEFLQNLNYPHTDETNNPVYTKYMR